MANGIIWAEGFDTLGASNNCLSRYADAAGNSFLGTAYGRFGGYGCRVLGSDYMKITPADGLGGGSSTYSHLILGCACQATYTMTEALALELWTFMDGTNVQVHFRQNVPLGFIAAYRGSGTSNLLGQSSNYSVKWDKWNYLELRVKFHGSTGEVEVRCNETQILNLSSQNTISTANAYADRVLLRANGNVDDVVLIDRTVGSGFLGDQRVVPLMPSGDSVVAWTKSGGASNAACVDEAAAAGTAPNADTDYVSSSTPTQKDLYTLPDLTGTPTVAAVQVISRARKDDAGTRTMRNLIDLSATQSTGATVTMTASYQNVQTVFETKPGGGAWAYTDVNTLVAGVECVA